MSINNIISNIVQQNYNNLSSNTVDEILTLGFRVSKEEMLCKLTRAEIYAIESINKNNSRFINSGGLISIAYSNYGRIYVIPRSEILENSNCLSLIADVELTEEQISSYNLYLNREKQELEKEREKIVNYFREFNLEEICFDLKFITSHMAPLIYYIGKICISNFYEIGKQGCYYEVTLEKALQTVLESKENSEIEYLTLVFCLHFLVKSGGYTRLEELNSRQISLSSLNDFFDKKYDYYKEYIKENSSLIDGIEFKQLEITEKACMLAKLRESLKKTDNRFVRDINALNLNKKEIILSSISSLHNIPKRSNLTENIIESWIKENDLSANGLNINSLEKSFSEFLVPQSGRFSSLLESLIDFVLQRVLHVTNSDFAMTRSTRNYKKFILALHSSDVQTVSSWGEKEYFCHVVPSTRMLSQYSGKQLIMLLNAMSGRMRYNTWHYAPSYFKITDIPFNREWFYAPQMADIAEYSDQHHNGHIYTQIRHSIRSPLPIFEGNRVLTGFIDLRLVRQTGSKYNLDDLKIAIQYTETLQYIYQNLMNYLISDKNEFEFKFGNKAWFKENYIA